MPSGSTSALDAGPDIEIVGFKPAEKTVRTSKVCKGYHLPVPEGQSPHTSYPFAMHGKHQVPWDCAVRGNQMYLFAHTCTERARDDGHPCTSCASLASNSIVRGIMDWMSNGACKGTTFAYLGWNELVESLNTKTNQISFLRFNTLNQTRAILRQKESLSNYKRLTMAIANEDVPRVARVVQVALKKKQGVAGIMEQVAAAARNVYSVKSFNDQDRLLAMLLWRLGGDRVGHIAHRALGLPSVSTLRDGSVKKPVMPSVGRPTAELIAQNTKSVLSGILHILKDSRQLIQQMIDKLATEKRVHYCMRTNKILGICRHHGPKVAQEFGTLDNVEELFKAVDSGKVHVASQVSDFTHRVLQSAHNVTP